MDELPTLLDRAAAIQAAGEDISATFASELAAVWRQLERAVVALAIEPTRGVRADLRLLRLVALRDQIRAALEVAGYDRLIGAATQVAAETIAAAQEAAAAGAVSADTIEALRRVAAVDLLEQGDATATAIWRAMTQTILAQTPRTDILGDLADVLDGGLARVTTLFDTLTAIYGRQLERIQTDELGGQQPFLYVGPIDDSTRPFCVDLVGKVLSRDAIDALDNGQLPNVFLTGGGFNCRHSWMAVESADLRAKMDTGERVGPAAEDVARVEARKRKR